MPARYTVYDESRIWTTTDPEKAEKESRNGKRVTAVFPA